MSRRFESPKRKKLRLRLEQYERKQTIEWYNQYYKYLKTLQRVE